MMYNYSVTITGPLNF